MSTALTDLLIDVAEPEMLILFNLNPEAFMEKLNLSEEDKIVLRTGDSSSIRLRANSVRDEDTSAQRRQFSAERTAKFTVAVIEVDPIVHVDIPTTVDLSTITPHMLYIDELGQLFKAVKDDHQL